MLRRPLTNLQCWYQHKRCYGNYHSVQFDMIMKNSSITVSCKSHRKTSVKWMFLRCSLVIRRVSRLQSRTVDRGCYEIRHEHYLMFHPFLSVYESVSDVPVSMNTHTVPQLFGSVMHYNSSTHCNWMLYKITHTYTVNHFGYVEQISYKM